MERIKKILMVGGFVLAQRALEVEYPEIGGVKPETTALGLPEYVKYIFNFSLGVAGLIAFSALIYGGMLYLTSAGSPIKMGEAKKQIFAALLGLLVLLGSYLILTTINPQLIFLELPERAIFTPEKIIPTEIEPETLYYTEIPIGEIAGILLAKERLDDIKDISEETKNLARAVAEKTQDLKSAIDQCACSNSEPTGTCETGDCSDTACTNNCGGCVSDPCPNREIINEKREELKTAIRELYGNYLPEGREKEGIYLCGKDFCRGSNWQYFSPDNKEVSNLGVWNNRATALAIIGPYNVQVYAKTSFREQSICFQNSVPRLDDYEVVPDNGWASDIESFKILDEGQCASPGLTMLGPSTSSKTGQLPSGEEKEGIYLCDNEQCKKGWRWTASDISNLCQSEPDLAQPSGNEMCAGSLKSQVGSLGIKGNFDVMLYEENNFQGRRICFSDSVGRLDDYEIAPNNGWNRDVDSIRILAEGECQNPGLTVLGPGRLTAGGLKTLEERKSELEEILNKLKEAERYITSCPGLYSYNNFWQYREYLEDQGIISKARPSYPFSEIAGGGSALYSSATFYCVENVFEVSPVKISEDIIVPSGEEFGGGEEMTCGEEIKFGQAIDKAEEVASELLSNLGGLITNAASEISAAEKMVSYSDEDCSDGKCCSLSNCSAVMTSAFWGECDDCGWDEEEEKEICPEEGESGECTTETIIIHHYIPCYYYCGSCSCYCSGSACPTEIAGLESQIISNYSQVQTFQQKLQDLKPPSFNDLREAQNQLRACYNSPQTQEKISKGEPVIWRELYSCTIAKQPEYGLSIAECYGPTPDKPELMDDFFCCQTEVSLK